MDDTLPVGELLGSRLILFDDGGTRMSCPLLRRRCKGG